MNSARSPPRAGRRSPVGSDVSEPITLTLTGPGSVSALPGFGPGPTWTCTHAASTWTCEHAALAPGETADPMSLPYQADTAVPGDVLTFTAEAAPEPHETSVTTNIGQGSVQVVTPGVIRVPCGVDTNRDG